MRIGLVSTLSTPVTPVGTGSVESIAWLLARELDRLGHQVTLFAAAGSTSGHARIVEVPGTYTAPGMPTDWLQSELLNVAAAVERSADLDVIHSHGYLVGRLIEGLSQAPLVHTLHTQPHQGEAALAALRPTLHLTALSSFQWARFPALRPLVIPSAVDLEQFTFRPDPEPRLCYLGRFLPDKGPLEAIRIARELGMPLIMAGPENSYLREVVLPAVDGRHVSYIGSVEGATRDTLLGGSAALLYPLQVGEPFGLVMLEAMMCGTPVLATDVGATREIIDEGVTGCVEALGGLVRSARSVLALDRAGVRARALERFSPQSMARAYERVYKRAVGGAERA